MKIKGGDWVIIEAVLDSEELYDQFHEEDREDEYDY